MKEDYILAKWLENNLTKEEHQDFNENFDVVTFEKIKKYSEELTTTEFDSQLILKNILSSKNKKTKVVSLQNWILRIAAVLLLIITVFYFTIINQTKLFESNNKILSNIILPDQSKIILNKNSQISYKDYNWKENRILKLDGEAFFKVSKGNKFKVETNLGSVTVLGTQFNVKTNNNKFEVVCFEGKVNVNYKNQNFILTKGKAVLFSDQEILQFETKNSHPNWNTNQNEIQFTNSNFKELISELESNYQIKINTPNFDSKQLFTGKLPKNNLEASLKIITSIYHLNLFKNNENSFTLKESK